jgi:hypothetical protein
MRACFFYARHISHVEVLEVYAMYCKLIGGQELHSMVTTKLDNVFDGTHVRGYINVSATFLKFMTLIEASCKSQHVCLYIFTTFIHNIFSQVKSWRDTSKVVLIPQVIKVK